MHHAFPPNDPNAMAYWRARRMVVRPGAPLRPHRRLSYEAWHVIHLLVYAVVNAWLWFRFFYFPSPPWSHYATTGWPWPLTTTLAWGLGLALHGLLVWSRLSRRGRDWEQRKIQEFMDRH